jgi:hypothetical protein
VTVTNNSGGTTKFTIRPTNTSGTGRATFSDGSTELIINGNAANQPLTVKGVTRSSQVDDLIIEAMLNNNNTVVASDLFTVGEITSLIWEKFDMDYLDLDANPGPGSGPNGLERGRRIFPDKKDVADAGGSVDRSLVRVKATVSPSLPNVQIYFGSYDLDDPSAVGPHIDPMFADGNDNNGTVNTSTSGDFVIPAGIICSDSNPPGHVPGRIGCSISSNGIAVGAFKTTMQPGDNFAIAASLNNSYRDGILVLTSDGSKLINSSAQEIPVSGMGNPNNVAGIRTEMLTVWRKLHIEVDSMGAATGNKVEGTMAQSLKVGTGIRTLMVTAPSPGLEVDRFENGRMVINGNSYRIIDAVPATPTAPAIHSNTVDSVTIFNNTVPFNINTTSTFTLYDDDDMDDDDGGYLSLNGDAGDDVPEPDTSLLTGGSDSPINNYMAPAYIQPVYDLTVSHENVAYVANLDGSNLRSVIDANFDNRLLEASVDFWTIYLLGAYQFEAGGSPNTVNYDADPYEEVGAIVTAAYGVSDVPLSSIHTTNPSGHGSVIFMEMSRANEYPMNYIGRPVSRAFTTAHEVGHLFSCDHTEQGLMEVTQLRSVGTFSETSISWIRKAMHP